MYPYAVIMIFEISWCELYKYFFAHSTIEITFFIAFEFELLGCGRQDVYSSGRECYVADEHSFDVDFVDFESGILDYGWICL